MRHLKKLLMGVLTEAAIMFGEAVILMAVWLTVYLLYFGINADFDNPTVQKVFLAIVIPGILLLEISRWLFGKPLWKKIRSRGK